MFAEERDSEESGKEEKDWGKTEKRLERKRERFRVVTEGKATLGKEREKVKGTLKYVTM